MERCKLESIRLKTVDNWNIVETISDKYNGYGYRFYPDKIKGEGFFIAALQKKDGDNFHFPKIKKSNFERLTKSEEAIAKKWIKENGNHSLVKKDDLVYAFPLDLVNDINLLQTSLYVKKAGVRLGKITPYELIPEHELALSNIINPKINSVQITNEQAINYLRKEEIKIDIDLKGWCIVKYENQNLGWIKILQNRINNYYPSEWRILKR